MSVKRGSGRASWVRLIVTCVCAFGFISAVEAGVVHLDNGDRITGKIKSLDGEKLVIVSDMVGEVSIPWEHVETFSSDEPVRLELEDGSSVQQPVASDEAGHVKISGAGVLEEQTINISKIKEIGEPKAEKAAEEISALEREKQRAPWKGDIGLGFSATRGNSNTNTGNFDLTLGRRRPDDRLGFEANYIFSEEKGDDDEDYEKTTDRGHIAGKYDYFFSQKLYGFGHGRVGRDQIADLDSRVLLDSGLGYQWVESEPFSFLTEAGLGWQVEDYEAAGEDTSAATARAGYDLSKLLLEWLTFKHTTDYYPLLEDFGNYFLTTKAELRAYYTERIYSNFQVRMDYESDPPPDRDSTDMFYILGAGVEF